MQFFGIDITSIVLTTNVIYSKSHHYTLSCDIFAISAIDITPIVLTSDVIRTYHIILTSTFLSRARLLSLLPHCIAYSWFFAFPFLVWFFGSLVTLTAIVGSARHSSLLLPCCIVYNSQLSHFSFSFLVLGSLKHQWRWLWWWAMREFCYCWLGFSLLLLVFSLNASRYSLCCRVVFFRLLGLVF